MLQYLLMLYPLPLRVTQLLERTHGSTSSLCVRISGDIIPACLVSNTSFHHFLCNTTIGVIQSCILAIHPSFLDSQTIAVSLSQTHHSLSLTLCQAGKPQSSKFAVAEDRRNMKTGPEIDASE